MLSSIFLSGRLGEVKGDHIREVEVDRVVPGPSGRFETDSFLVRSQNGLGTEFFAAKKGSLIVLKGRLEVDPVHGVVIVSEIDEIYRSPLEKETSVSSSPRPAMLK